MATTMTKNAASLVHGLNEDLAREYQAIVRYVTFAATVHGPFRPVLAALFRSEVADELGHAHYLADKIVALGGSPMTEIGPVSPVTDAREMLLEIVRVEREDIETYTRRAQEAETAGELALKVQLENMVADETRHAEEVQKILDGWR